MSHWMYVLGVLPLNFQPKLHIPMDYKRAIALQLNYHGFRQTGEDVNKEIKP